MDDREWMLALLFDYIAEDETRAEITDRILAGLQERGWFKESRLQNGADLVRDWQPTINGNTTGD